MQDLCGQLYGAEHHLKWEKHIVVLSPFRCFSNIPGQNVIFGAWKKELE